MKNVELLAPAGNFESLRTAINNGANAIYLGLTDFNARRKASNFTVDSIREVVRYAHLFNAKIYLTVNTIIKNEEVDAFLKMVDKCVEAKVDAYIIQDLGMAYLLSKRYKGIVLHASTQMGIHNLEGAKIVEQLGFKRAILSRETSLEDIKEIRDNTNLEIEFFVQGALCVGFSGNCYMSSFLSLNSGNRGLCQQYCRKQYIVKDNDSLKDKAYYLSTKDICLINKLKTLVDAGVTSFKIEGRLKREGYVGVVISTYRKIIDNAFKDASKNDLEALRVSFSRGDFSYEAYLNHNKEGMMNPINQNHIGIKIGTLTSVKPFKNDLLELEIVSNHELHSGDGLKFMWKNKEIASLGVGNIIKKGNNTYKIFTKQKIKEKGLDVYLTLDYQNEEELINKVKKLPVDIKVIAKENENLIIKIVYKKIEVSYKSPFVCNKAINQPTTFEDIKKQVEKLNDTNFVLRDLSVDNDQVFIVKSALNEARRSAVILLENAIIETFEKRNAVTINKDLDFTYSLDLLDDALIINEEINLDLLPFDYKGLIIYSPLYFNKEVIAHIKEIKTKFINAKVALNLPIIAFKEDLKIINEIVNDLNDVYLIANNLYALTFINKAQLIGGYNLNINNNYALSFLNHLGIKYAFASLESNEAFLKENPNLYYYALGYNTLMNYVHCPIKTIYKNDCKMCKYNKSISYIDEYNKNYALRRIKINYCYFELLNNRLINCYKKISNPSIVDLRNLDADTFEKTLKMLENKTYMSISNNEFFGLLFKSIS